MNKIGKTSMEKKIINSNFKICKNYKIYMIVPLIILLISLILMFTVDFHFGYDFTGGSTFKVYVNTENQIEDSTVYDLENSNDYNTVYNKIKTVLDQNGLKIISYKTSSMNIESLDVINGHAVEVIYQNSVNKDEDIFAENNIVREQLLATFDYVEYNNAISTIDQTFAKSSYDWSIGILASVVFATIVALIYMSLRFHSSACPLSILQVALDQMLLIALVLMTRLTVNFNFGIAILTTLVISIVNLFAFYNKNKNNIVSGKYEKMKNKQMADATTKELLFKKSIIYVVLLFITIIFASIAVEGVREVALAIMLSLIVTFYTSTFIMPSIWALIYKPKNKKVKS